METTTTPWRTVIPPVLHVESDDTLTEDGGGLPLSTSYAQLFWLPTLGPTAFLLARRLLDIGDRPNTADRWVEVSDLMAELGVGGPGMKPGGQNNPIIRSLRRLESFGCGTVDGDEVTVRRYLPYLTEGQYRRLTPALQARYDFDDPGHMR